MLLYGGPDERFHLFVYKAVERLRDDCQSSGIITPVKLASRLCQLEAPNMRSLVPVSLVNKSAIRSEILLRLRGKIGLLVSASLD
ncbi:hypothetical protein R1flu_017807 [Riccia fluitans]|uniref:Uncharacterized protein n=1 Tax=Riccia fluitans TaxID=41844 RepID=A0ABD1ZE10_9MARC